MVMAFVILKVVVYGSSKVVVSIRNPKKTSTLMRYFTLISHGIISSISSIVCFFIPKSIEREIVTRK